MMRFNHLLRKCTAGYKLSSSQVKINDVIYIDDIKLFAKNEKELETLIHAVKIYNQDIRMEFGIEKCATLIMKRRKWHMTEGMDLPNQEKIRTLEAEYWKWKYWKWKWKKKLRKSISGEREIYSKPNYTTETL